MRSSVLARRYANALFDVAKAKGLVDHVERDLTTLRGLLDSHEELRHVLGSTAIPPAKKRGVAEAVMGQLRDLTDETRRTITMLAERDRLALIGPLAMAFEERLMTERQIVAAEVVTAVPLGDARRAALAQALGKASGRTVQITDRVDPSLIGGIVATLGGTVFDGSVARQIERLREKLVNDIS